MSYFTLSYLALWLVVGVETLAMILILREIGILYLARRESFGRDGPKLGERLPDFVAKTRRGETRDIADLPAAITALVFGSTGCRLCIPAFNNLLRWSARVADFEPVLLVEQTSERGLPKDIASASKRIWILEPSAIHRTFGIRASPYVVMVDQAGTTLSKGIVNYHSDIKRLLREARVEVSPGGEEATFRPSRHNRTLTPAS